MKINSRAVRTLSLFNRWSIEKVSSHISKTVFTEGLFSLLQCCQVLSHGCHYSNIDLKLRILGPIDSIFTCVKFGGVPISSLDFSFTEGRTLLRAG